MSNPEFDGLTRSTQNIEFDTPIKRVLSEFQPKNKFRIDTSLPDLSFLRQLSVQGRLRYFQGDNASSPFITITPAVGDTLFIYKVIVTNNAISGNLFTFTNDGNLRYNVRIADVSAGGSAFEIDIFDSLVGDIIEWIEENYDFEPNENARDAFNTISKDWESDNRDTLVNTLGEKTKPVIDGIQDIISKSDEAPKELIERVDVIERGIDELSASIGAEGILTQINNTLIKPVVNFFRGLFR